MSLRCVEFYQMMLLLLRILLLILLVVIVVDECWGSHHRIPVDEVVRLQRLNGESGGHQLLGDESAGLLLRLTRRLELIHGLLDLGHGFLARH